MEFIWAELGCDRMHFCTNSAHRSQDKWPYSEFDINLKLLIAIEMKFSFPLSKHYIGDVFDQKYSNTHWGI